MSATTLRDKSSKVKSTPDLDGIEQNSEETDQNSDGKELKSTENLSKIDGSKSIKSIKSPPLTVEEVVEEEPLPPDVVDLRNFTTIGRLGTNIRGLPLE